MTSYPKPGKFLKVPNTNKPETESLKTLIREAGETCRQVWINLLSDGVSVNATFEEFCGVIIHSSLAHWDKFRSVFQRAHDNPTGGLSLAEQISLHKHGDIEHPAPILSINKEIADGLAGRLKDVEPVFDYYEVVRWTTVHFWGLQWRIYDPKEEQVLCSVWHNALKTGQETEQVLALLDTSVLEGVCASKNKPSPLFELVSLAFGSCNPKSSEKVVN